MKKVFVILGLLFTATLAFSQKNVFQNTQLVFEDDRKTFAIYACWNLKTYIDKGQYGDEHNVIYSYELKYHLINKNNKRLVLSWIWGGGMGSFVSYVPFEDRYIDSGFPDFVDTFDNKTGKLTFKTPAFKFQFYDDEKTVK